MIVLNTKLGLKLFSKGKVRDIYDLGDSLLMIATDRISAFDHILPQGIPYKGIILNQLSLFWFNQTKKIVPNHIITGDVSKFPEEAKKYKELLRNRSVVIKKAKPAPIECVVRGYLSGSGWKEYKEKNSICGIELPKGLRESEKLPEPIFTPATKSQTGHDINITQEQAEKEIGKELADKLIDCSLEIYEKCTAQAEKKGIIIADTKLEFGLLGDEVILIDELLTPDSSRFWPLEGYEPGKPQNSFDKQFVRDYLESINWNKEPPVPDLPENIINKTSQKYIQAYERVIGKKFKP